MPSDENLRELRQLYNFVLILFRGCRLTALGNEVSARITQLICLLDGQHSLVIASEIPRLNCALRVRKDGNLIGSVSLRNLVKAKQDEGVINLFNGFTTGEDGVEGLAAIHDTEAA